MKRFVGVASAALAALAIWTATPSAEAAPAMTGTGNIVLEGTPQVAEEVGWRGGRRFGGPRYYRPGRFYRPARFYRPYYRPYYRPVYARPAYYGARCFWRPARTVWTPYGWRWRPAARICRW
jgi:hypothetical protein